MTAGQQRKIQRAVHVAAGFVVVAYVYAPRATGVHDVLRFLVLPVLVFTGVAMWQAARIRRFRKKLQRTERSSRTA